MKNSIILTASLLLACSGVCAEEKAGGKASDPASRTVVFEEAGGQGMKEIDAGSPPSSAYPPDGGVDDSGAMPPYESYDPNTGLRNAVPSDSDGEFDE